MEYDEAIDNILTGDIHLVPDVFLFTTIQKRMDDGKRDMLSEINIYDLLSRRNTNLFLQ